VRRPAIFWGVTTDSFTGKEKAVFGKAAYAFANGFKITVGGRGFRTETVSDTGGFGPFYAALVNGLLNSTPPAVSQSNSGAARGDHDEKSTGEFRIHRYIRYTTPIFIACK
jgi:hypothetical protein